MVICKLCGKEVPMDDAGIGQTLVVVHAHEHNEERKRLGMTQQDYVAMCKAKLGGPGP